MSMRKESISKVQRIGDLVCEGCSDDSDCGINPSECDRVAQAIDIFHEDDEDDEDTNGVEELDFSDKRII